MKPNWLKKSETAIIVTLITMLVWLYAEGETIVQEQRTIRIQLIAPPGEELAIYPREPQTVRLTFRCSAASLRRVNQLTAAPVMIPVGAGQSLVQISSALQNVFADQAVQVVDARTELGQESLTIRAESVVPVAMTVQPSLTGITQMEINIAAVNPETVTVHMPESLVQQARASALTVRMADIAALEQLVGDAERRTLSIRLPDFLQRPEDRVFIRLEEATAEVTFSISRLTDSFEVTGVPLMVQIPPSAAGSNQIEPELRTLARVTLSGPRQTIERLRARSFVPRAVIDLTDIELFAGTQPSQVSARVQIIDLPPGVTWSPENIQVEVTIRPLNN